MSPARPSSAGFATIAAIFLLVVLAALGAFAVTISSTQQVAAGQDVRGTRAYWAARAGIEWAVGSLTASPGACPTPPAPFTVDGFTLTVACTRAPFDESGVKQQAARAVYRLTANASAGGTAGSLSFVERSVSASVEF